MTKHSIIILIAVLSTVLAPSLYGQDVDVNPCDVAQLEFPVIFTLNMPIVPINQKLAYGYNYQLSIGKPLIQPSDAGYFTFGFGQSSWGDEKSTILGRRYNRLYFIFAALEFRRTWQIFKDYELFLTGGGGVGSIKWSIGHGTQVESLPLKPKADDDTYIGVFSTGIKHREMGIEYRSLLWQKPKLATHSLGLNVAIPDREAVLHISTMAFLIFKLINLN